MAQSSSVAGSMSMIARVRSQPLSRQWQALEGGLDLGQEGGGDGGVDQQRLGGVADGDVLALGIDGDPHGHVEVGVGVDVDVADAVGVAEDRDVRVVHDVADELVGAAGDDQVDLLVEGEHVGDVLAGFEQVDPAGGQAGGVGRPGRWCRRGCGWCGRLRCRL